jgi:two-component system, NarL family, nitrate/nitrite response regulator NarL
MSIRIIIADRQELFREALRRILEQESDFAVVAETGDGEQLLRLIPKIKPDVLLMDIKLRRRPGIEALREIVSLYPEVHPILLTDSIDNEGIVQALIWGTRGVVCKDSPTPLLIKCIRAVGAGEYWISRSGVSNLVKNLRSFAALAERNARERAHNLTRQQQHILEAIVAGCSNKEIAKELSISERTVKYHLTRIFSKFGVSGRTELARFSMKNKIISQA